MMGGATLCSIGAFLIVYSAVVTQGYHVGGGANEPGSVRCFADIVFVLDSSGSVGDANWRIVKNFVKNFTYMLHFSDEENQVAVISYGNEAHFHIGLTDYKQHADPYLFINSTMDNQVPWLDQHTNTAAGLRMVIDRVFTPEAGDRSNFPNVVILISDGFHTMDTDDTEPLANQLKESGAYIITIGIGNEGVMNSELMKIASQESSFYGVMGFNLLNSILSDITDNVCQVTQQCRDKNIAFLLDSSGSMGSSNFQKVKEFVKRFMNHVNMATRSNRVGLLSYSTEATTIARLGEIEDQDELNRIVDNVPHVNQRTNISGAIWRAMHDILLPKPVERRNASDVIILLTDGWDNTDPALMIENARAAKARGARIFAVGVGDKVHMLNMMRIASAPGFYNTFVTPDHDELVLQAMTGRGETLLDLVCMAEDRFPPANFPVTTANAERNVVLILDATSTVGRDRFNQICSYLSAALVEMEMDYNVAVIVMGRGDATVAVNFGDFDVSNKILNLEFEGGSSNLAKALITSFLIQGSSNAENTHVLMFVASHISNAMISSPELAIKYNLATNSWASFDGLMLDMREHLEERNYVFYTVGLGIWEDMDLMSQYQSLEDFTYSLVGLSVEEERKFCTALLAMSQLHAAEILWDCDFDQPSGTISDIMCQAENKDTMNFDLRSGRTPSRFTGPNSAFSGPNYLYIEATNKRPGQHAVLALPRTDLSGPVCLRFMRHMYGWHIGVLQVVLFTPSGDERVVWQQYGPQGDTWIYTEALIMPSRGDQIAVVASRAYGYSGDIAVDSMTLTRGPCDLPDEMNIVLDIAEVHEE